MFFNFINRDSDGAIVRPLPRIKRLISEATCLPHIVQVNRWGVIYFELYLLLPPSFSLSVPLSLYVPLSPFPSLFLPKTIYHVSPCHWYRLMMYGFMFNNSHSVGAMLPYTYCLSHLSCCCCLLTPMTLASGGSPMFPLVVHQPASPSIWPAVQSLRRGLSTNPGVTMWCVCGCS